MNADAPAQTGPAAPTAEHSPTLSDRLLALVADGDLPAVVRATAEAALDDREQLSRRAGHCSGRPCLPACGYCGSDRQCERCGAISAELRAKRELREALGEIERLRKELDRSREESRQLTVAAQAIGEAGRAGRLLVGGF